MSYRNALSFLRKTLSANFAILTLPYLWLAYVVMNRDFYTLAKQRPVFAPFMLVCSYIIPMIPPFILSLIRLRKRPKQVRCAKRFRIFNLIIFLSSLLGLSYSYSHYVIRSGSFSLDINLSIYHIAALSLAMYLLIPLFNWLNTLAYRYWLDIGLYESTFKAVASIALFFLPLKVAHYVFFGHGMTYQAILQTTFEFCLELPISWAYFYTLKLIYQELRSIFFGTLYASFYIMSSMSFALSNPKLNLLSHNNPLGTLASVGFMVLGAYLLVRVLNNLNLSWKSREVEVTP